MLNLIRCWSTINKYDVFIKMNVMTNGDDLLMDFDDMVDN